MPFYHNFKYQYTTFHKNVGLCIEATKLPKNIPALSFIYSVNTKSRTHTIVRAIVNGRVYGRKHAQRMGFKSLKEFAHAQFINLNPKY